MIKFILLAFYVCILIPISEAQDITGLPNEIPERTISVLREEPEGVFMQIGIGESFLSDISYDGSPGIYYVLNHAVYPADTINVFYIDIDQLSMRGTLSSDDSGMRNMETIFVQSNNNYRIKESYEWCVDSNGRLHSDFTNLQTGVYFCSKVKN